ncbi:UNVERIFIED_CONTAM: hypothetical protein Sradi_4758400 [Sesamum radiatum]|uniref:Uncharacterized protein n=1 Tax=Sesamum radiatum TaxID=300843 RepID=A0AAW2MWA1_SESRA
MALRAKVLQKKAEKFEHKKLQVLKVTKERVSALEPLLQDVYASRRPKPTDYEVRRDLVRVFNEIAKEIYDGTDPATVVKSLSNFVNYGKRNRETLAELFVTLLIKLSSVEKLWPKGLCASTCSGSWTSKTWDSKVASISESPQVEDFTDQSQNVARAVGLAEVKQIYKCIDISIRHIFSFIDGQIGIELRDLMFGQDGMPTRIPRGTPHLHPIAALPCIPSQANQTKGLVSGKRRKQTMRMDSALPYRITPVECRTGTQSGSQEQVQQAILLDSVSTKKMRTAEGWRGMPSGSQEAAHMGGCVATQQPIDPRERQQPMGGWSGVYAGGWEGTQQPAAVGWGLTQQPSARGWEVARQPTAGGWGGAQQTTGWVGAQQATDWGGAQQATSWGGAQQTTGWGGAQQATSWGGAHQTTGLGGAQQTTGSGGAQQATGWGGAHQPGVGWDGHNNIQLELSDQAREVGVEPQLLSGEENRTTEAFSAYTY